MKKIGAKGMHEKTTTTVEDTRLNADDLKRAVEYLPTAKQCGLYGKDAINIYKRIAPQLNHVGRLNDHFIDEIVQYCMVLARVNSAQKELDKIGWTYTTTTINGTQIKTHPRVAQLNTDTKVLRTYLQDLGLTPKDFKAVPQELQQQVEDEFDKL